MKINKVSLVFLCAGVFFFQGSAFALNNTLISAETFILQDNYQQAAKECRRVLSSRQKKETAARAYYLLGLCLLKQGRYAEARKNFNIVLRRYPHAGSCENACAGVADSYFMGGDYKEAVKDYLEFLRRFPQSGLCEVVRAQMEQCRQSTGFTNHYFTVQMGCFLSEDNASSLRDKLINCGHQAYILKLPSDDFYRVRVGKFETRLDAEFTEQRLKAQGYSTKVCP